MSAPNRISDQNTGPSVTAPDRSGIMSGFRLEFAMLLPILAVAALVTLLPPNGNERGQWMQFIGRFHPLLVHFPIALFLLVPILEIAGRSARFAYLRLSVSFVLMLATLAAMTAAMLGWCLARSGGYSGRLITQHMWGGVLLSLVCWACWLMRTRLREFDVTYTIALALGVGLVAWTGYRGGQLSLGTNHLTEHMPHGLRTLLGIENNREASRPAADPNTFYGARVQPIFTERCINCHGEDKQKGNLRLDSYRGLMRGGKNGPAIQAGNAQASDLLRRISLPPNHDDFMPKGKQPLSPDQVKAIELWIGRGASETLAVDAIKNAPSGSSAPSEVAFEEVDPAAVTKLRSTIAPAISQLQEQFPGVIDYESRGSADLRLNASILGSKFGDQDLQAFGPVADHIIIADLSRTAVTDHSAAAIVAMKRLRVLRIVDTQLTDAALSHIDGLNQLESLDVYGSPITPAVLPMITKLPKLSRFYAGQTGIRPSNAVPRALAGKIVF